MTSAMLASSTSANRAAAAGETGQSSRLAGRTGTARTTASADSTRSSARDPVTSCHRDRAPSGPLRRSSRTVTPVRTWPPVASTAARTASGSRPTPPVSPAKTGAGAPAERPRSAIVRAVATALSPWRAASHNAGTVACKDNRLACPA